MADLYDMDGPVGERILNIEFAKSFGHRDPLELKNKASVAKLKERLATLLAMHYDASTGKTRCVAPVTRLAFEIDQVRKEIETYEITSGDKPALTDGKGEV